MVIPMESGGVRITVNKKLNHISKLGQLPIPRVDQVLDSLGSGRVFSLFDMVFLVPPDTGTQGHSPSYSVLYTHRPL